ncbi:MAG: type II toxin-antitoxin system HicB family antitoxin [Dehalococcoidia bacterium]|nr:type II toxin-antitoxin system HicB family antitoxin [Dehalococcoidia bacterium]MCA9854379.1 type II toxin-antitoxin system HicB family antitoxin [Dehalococcoidia bacterium]
MATGESTGDTARRYAVVIEHAGKNFSAYVPDLPGCIATGETVEEALREIAEAVSFHIEGMKEDGLKIPPAVTVAEYVIATG